MGNVLSMPEPKASKYKAEPIVAADFKPVFKPSMRGISHVPDFAQQDCIRATERYFLASNPALTKSEHEYIVALRDRAHYLELLSDTTDEIDDELIFAFIKLVTGYPRIWIASWSYISSVHQIMASGATAEEIEENVTACYRDAIQKMGLF